MRKKLFFIFFSNFPTTKPKLQLIQLSVSCTNSSFHKTLYFSFFSIMSTRASKKQKTGEPMDIETVKETVVPAAQEIGL